MFITFSEVQQMGSWNFTVTSEQTKRDPEKNVNTLAMKFSHEMKLSEFEDMEDIKIWNDEITFREKTEAAKFCWKCFRGEDLIIY